MNEAVLETPRLRLREMTPADLDFVAAMLAHPEVNRYYDRLFSRADSELWIARQVERYRRDGHGLWLAEDRSTGEPVGQIGLVMQTIDGVPLPEVGWLLDRRYWGRGYATEAGAAARDAAFDRWRYDRVISLIRPNNVPSQRVAQRLGMTATRRTLFYGSEHLVYETHEGGRAAGTDHERR